MATPAQVVERAASVPLHARAHTRLEAVPELPADQPLADGTLSARWLEAWLGLQPARLERLRAEGELLAIPAAGADPVYPVWQFGPDGSVLRGTRHVIAAAAAADVEPARLHALMAARAGLAGGGHLAGLLREGRVDHVVAVVRASGTDA